MRYLNENDVISVANRTETAARINYAFSHKRIGIDELCVPEHILHIDSKTLEAVEAVDIGEVSIDGAVEAVGAERQVSKKETAAILRDKADTVGQAGKRGEQIRNVISVGMLSEGWDAKTVTHILGLRAFTSQLLCEQVIGRGLRRTSYEDFDVSGDMFEPEYVNIFGIPFTFLPHESDETGTPKPTKPKTQVEAVRDKAEYQICWPNIVRLDRELRPTLSVDINTIDTLVIEESETRVRADLAPVVACQTDLRKCSEIDLYKLDAGLRWQKVIFEAAGQTYEMMTSWHREATKFALFGQIVRLVEKYLARDGAVVIDPPLFNTDNLRRKIIYMMNMSRIVQHLCQAIELSHTDKIVPIFDPAKKTLSTGDMSTWFTGKPCFITKKSHISHCVFDSGWEAADSFILDKNPNVSAWAKNDHLGFEIDYIFDGAVKKYYPDFLIKLTNGKTLLLETKGQKSPQSEVKRRALTEWVAAVNGLGDYGEWVCAESYNIADVDGIIGKCL